MEILTVLIIRYIFFSDKQVYPQGLILTRPKEQLLAHLTCKFYFTICFALFDLTQLKKISSAIF